VARPPQGKPLVQVGAKMKGFPERSSVRFTICLSLLLLLIPLPARAQNGGDQSAPQAAPVPVADAPTAAPDGPGASDSSSVAAVEPNYVLGPEDVIDIEVFNVPELKESVRVAADGKITLPLIGRVPASGLTADQLRQELVDKWGENYLQDPQVSVFV